jgi:virginiamycin B lyase
MQILNGPQQAVWGVLADYSRNPTLYSVAEFSVSGSSIGIVHDFTLPQGDSIASMTVGGDGRFWFTDSVRNAIGRFDTSGSVREFALHAANALAPPWFGQWQIATACDGAVWFAEPGPNKIGRIDAKGAIDEFALRTADAGPAAVASTEAPHHKCTPPELWVGEQHANALAAVAF